MTQRGSPEKLAGIAHEIQYIYDRVGMERWRFVAGEPCGGADPVPQIELPDWSQVSDENELIHTCAVKKAPKIYVRQPWLSPPSNTGMQLARTYKLTERGVRLTEPMTSPDSSLLPCGHRGIRNPRGVDGLVCQHDGCDGIFPREVVTK